MVPRVRCISGHLEGGGKMKIINLTPHPVVLERVDGTKKTYPPSGTVARAKVGDEVIDVLDGAPVRQGQVLGFTDLPEPQQDTVYIVSLFVLQHANRDDLIAPDTNSAIRDDEGRIIAVKGWRK